MFEITEDDIQEARAMLHGLGVHTRYDEEGTIGMAAVLGYIGECLKCAVMLVADADADADAGPAAVRRAIACYLAWEELPATAAMAGLPRDFSPVTFTVLERLRNGLKESV